MIAGELFPTRVPIRNPLDTGPGGFATGRFPPEYGAAFPAEVASQDRGVTGDFLPGCSGDQADYLAVTWFGLVQEGERATGEG